MPEWKGEDYPPEYRKAFGPDGRSNRKAVQLVVQQIQSEEPPVSAIIVTRASQGGVVVHSLRRYDGYSVQAAVNFSDPTKVPYDYPEYYPQSMYELAGPESQQMNRARRLANTLHVPLLKKK